MIVVNIDKAKAVSHDLRRVAREKEFKPYDEIIAKQIPGKSSTEAESARQEIRDKYAKLQSDIDAATTPDELAALVYSVRPDLKT